MTTLKRVEVGAKLGLQLAAMLVFSSVTMLAQGPQSRITGAVQNATRATVRGSKPPRALAANDAGPVSGSQKISGVSILFNRSAEQQADLDGLLAAQQNPGSPLYHQWLTPDQFAARFGMSDADLAAVRTWLEGQGFSVDATARGRDRMTFSGTAAQITAAFQAELHAFRSTDEAGTVETHFAPANDLTVPAAFAGTVLTISNVSDFRPKPHMVKTRPAAAAPRFDSGQTSSHFLTPGDLAAIYDVKAAYNAGYTGAGQAIAVAGQSAIIPSDVTNFQTAAGLTAQAPTMVLMPGTGASAINPSGTGDEGESDLDVEYSGGVAKGAQIYFVYTGANTNYGVFDALTYAISNRIAPILTVSYGVCEAALGTDTYTPLFQQAMSQGQTLIASTGDEGSTDCYEFTSEPTTVRTGLAVDFPASSPYVTAMGGTEFLAADVVSTNTQYWAANTGSDIVTSALGYIPEQVWNDDSASVGLSSGGGGVSLLYARPSWQISSGAPGLGNIAGSNRLVPDLALSSSPNNAGYLYCSSDTGSTGIEGSCTHGFRDANNVYLTVAGGTSFAAPIFAGMLAIINQATKSAGQGLINPTLYGLAANSTTYGSAFHDITSGSNECLAGSGYCTTIGASSYVATTGYDEASGLGSVDLYNLLTAWPQTISVAAARASVLTLTPATTVPKAQTGDAITITVTAASGTTTIAPTGTVTITVNGGASSSVTLVNGTATYSFPGTVAGQYVVVATYSGDANYASSSATTLIQVGSTGGFSLAATNATITDGSTGTATVTVTPVNGYTGTVNLSVTTNPVITNACYQVTTASVAGTSAATATVTIITNEASCTATTTTLAKHPVTKNTAANQMPKRGPGRAPVGFALAGLLAFGFLGRRSRGLRSLVAVALVAVAGFGMSGCGSGSVTSSPISTPIVSTTYATKGAYTIVVQGTDSVNAANTSFATFTLTIQ